MLNTNDNCQCGLHWGHTGKHAPHTPCNNCHGMGQEMTRETSDDFTLEDCEDCHGTGVMYVDEYVGGELVGIGTVDKKCNHIKR